VGKKADVILIETRRFEWRPLYSVVNNLVYSATGDSVATTIVNGKLLVDQRRLTTLDEKRTLAYLQARSDATLVRAGIQVKLNWPVE